MKKQFLTALFIVITSIGFAQENNNWGEWNWLLGKWNGEGNGTPGQLVGTDTFTEDLNNNIILRRSKTGLPSNNNQSEKTHESLMVIYLDYTKQPSKAIYFDNEGHTITYTITYAKNQIILQSEAFGNAPIFRLSYSLIDKNTMLTTFEMSQDGKQFRKYVEGKSKKTQ